MRACIEAVESRFPGFLELVFEADGSLRRYVRVSLNGEVLAGDCGDATVAEDDRIEIVAAAAGG